MKKILWFLCLTLSASFLNAQAPSVNMVQFATGYSSPVDIKSCGDDRLFIVEQAGYIRILSKDGTKQTTPFLDIHLRVNSVGNEQGLLTLAFSPTYKQDGYFYVNYINGSGSGSTRVSRFSVYANDSTQADPNSEVILLTFTQPYTNHNGATLMFGKDGYLYDSQGDGGSGSDPLGNGQSKNTLLGKMLRLDVSNHDTTYTIPVTNPFVGQANTREEIWAYGLRNPWRCAFDRLTGDMWIGDVGQDSYEEVDFQSAGSLGGENYGWRCREGLHACPNCNVSGCPSTGFVDPVSEQPQSNGSCSMTGGYVYRGTQYSKLFGAYLHSDFCSGKIWAITSNGNNTFTSTLLTVYVNGTQTYLANNIGTFGEDNEGELYIAGRANGRIYRLTETSDCKPVAFISLNDTVSGCNVVSLAALRGDTLSYQWYNSQGLINGATSYQFSATQSGWYKVKVAKQQAGCETMSDSVYADVKDTTVITPGTGPTVLCNNTSPVALTTYLQPTGGVYSGPAVSGNTFTPALVSAGLVPLNYAYTNASGCSSNAQLVLQVNDTTTLLKNEVDSVFCITDGPVSLSAFYNYAGQFSGNGVSNDNVTFNPASAGAGVTPVSFVYTNANSCLSAATFNVTVATPTALNNVIADTTFCSVSSPFSLTGFVLPVGGTFSGSGVVGTTFDPASVGIGSNKIKYTYSNASGCVSEDSFTISVAICQGINELGKDLFFNIYPNPGKGIFNLQVQVKNRQKAEVLVADAAGKVCYTSSPILESGQSTLAIDLSALAKGNYTVLLKSKTGSFVRGLIVE
jgi:glucose/arabinose dehydrogenase